MARKFKTGDRVEVVSVLKNETPLPSGFFIGIKGLITNFDSGDSGGYPYEVDHRDVKGKGVYGNFNARELKLVKRGNKKKGEK